MLAGLDDSRAHSRAGHAGQTGVQACAPPPPATPVSETRKKYCDSAYRRGTTGLRQCAETRKKYRDVAYRGGTARTYAGAPPSCMLVTETNHMRPDTDYYEVLQVSRNADIETIHRVYRIMASRFHPDNPRTGDTETFLLLRRAYQVLSDAEQRAKYDATRLIEDEEPLPIFELKDFVYGLKGEVNRRLGVLSLLYNRRRSNEDNPGLSVLDLEKRMAFPREHLNFALWYLKAKGYVRQEDNSDCGITAQGIDFIESHSSSDELVKKLIHSGPSAGTSSTESMNEPPVPGDLHSARLALAS